ncbi:MAG: aspartate carbamoyltransferase catalytic subunit [Moraxellaceae bacterium]|nr:aspartate carbamoyltransferase catalytic subunit [Pseudobdellovibrionaceae bacterium]
MKSSPTSPTILSLLDFQNLNSAQIFSFIQTALDLKKRQAQAGRFLEKQTILGTGALLFFEPSTRTRFSFETACIRAGVAPLIMDNLAGSSLEKGESIEDTILNLEAMGPLFFVVRCSDQTELREISEKLKTPVINAGWGKKSHPTQALLDATTLFERWGDLRDKNILFVGDVLHSRVFSSHVELSKILGYRLGYCAPTEFGLGEFESLKAGIKSFDQIRHALEWADAVITLRVQKERHDSISGATNEDYRQRYGLNLERAKLLKPSAVILHPGPINYGVEIEKNLLKDSRSVILQLVENGVFIREVLIKSIISGEI